MGREQAPGSSLPLLYSVDPGVREFPGLLPPGFIWGLQGARSLLSPLHWYCHPPPCLALHGATPHTWCPCWRLPQLRKREQRPGSLCREGIVLRLSPSLSQLGTAVIAAGSTFSYLVPSWSPSILFKPGVIVIPQTPQGTQVSKTLRKWSYLHTTFTVGGGGGVNHSTAPSRSVLPHMVYIMGYLN